MRSILLALLAAVCLAQSPKPAPADRKTDAARVDEILRLNREILEQHQAYQRINDEKIRRLMDLLADYQRRWMNSRASDELTRVLDRSAEESRSQAQMTSLESQVRRLEQQVRDLEQRLADKDREIRQLEDRLRMQP